MKTAFFAIGLSLCMGVSLSAADKVAGRATPVILDDAGVKNLRIQTAVAEPGGFDETVFALGRIDVYPGRRAAISSRIPGRALEVLVTHDHAIEKGATAVVVESRQAGDPPPRVALHAPISGLVSAVNIVPGQPVSPDNTLAEIIDLTEVYAIARVPEHLAGRLKPGQETHIKVAATGGRIFPATLEHLGVLADAESGTVEAAFHVDNPGLVLRPGMRAEFSIVVARHEDITTVPRGAVQGTPAERFVYVKDFDLPNAFIKTPVVTGRSNERFIEITSGLLPGDEVVTQGAYSLSFAGGGTLSLKEALDAAHGHTHNADGSEISASKGDGAPGHGHAHDDEHDHEDGRANLIWKILTGVFFVAFVVTLFTRKTGSNADHTEVVPPSGNR